MSYTRTDNTQLQEKQQSKQMLEQLYIIFADTYVLYVKTQNFHWNVASKNFYALHKFFEEQYEELSEAIDLIAEHIRTFDVPAPGSMRQFLSQASLQEEDGVVNSEEMVTNLYRDHEALAQRLQRGIAFADEHGEAATSDMLVGRLRAHNKMAWMLRASLPSRS